jgi:hypothetical protein
VTRLLSEVGPVVLRPARGAAVWAELVILTLLAPALGFWLRRDDPFFLAGGFPWPLAGVILVAIRYGAFRGLLSVLCLAVAFGVAHKLHALTATGLPTGHALGAVFCALVCGEFRDAWGRRLDAGEAEVERLQERLRSFSRVYHLLRTSHDRLEQRVHGGPPTLRDQLAGLAGRTIPEGEKGLQKLAADFLALTASSAGVLSGAVLGLPTAGLPGATALATLGEGEAPGIDDPLIQECLAQGKLVSLKEGLEREAASSLMVAAPLIDARGVTLGVLAVRTLRFIALHEDNLKLLAVLGGHFADLVSQRMRNGEAPQVLFLEQLQRAATDAQTHRAPSALVLAVATTVSAEAHLDALSAECRARDPALPVRSLKGQRALALLTRLSSPEDVERVTTRLDQLSGGTLRIEARPVTAKDDLATLTRWLKTHCELDDATVPTPHLRPVPRALQLLDGSVG